LLNLTLQEIGVEESLYPRISFFSSERRHYGTWLEASLFLLWYIFGIPFIFIVLCVDEDSLVNLISGGGDSSSRYFPYKIDGWWASCTDLSSFRYDSNVSWRCSTFYCAMILSWRWRLHRHNFRLLEKAKRFP